MRQHHLTWSHGRARVLTTAAMLAECTFALPAGPFSPFARAPWMGQFGDPETSAHLFVLGAEYVCLPFGKARPIPQAPPDWAAILTEGEGGKVHGPAADMDWSLDRADDTSAELSLAYPEPSPVLRLERRIAAREGAPALDLSLTIHARRPAQVSVGLHPILRLPQTPGRLRIEADFGFGLVHPGQTGSMRQEFHSLAAVPRPGGDIDLSHLPLSPQTDLNVQLCGMRGPLTATYLDEGAGLVIDWDRTLLPSLQIWHTDRGIGGPPWHNAYRGLGLEPIAAAFDLGDRTALADNPIRRRGVPTSLTIQPEHPLVIRYTLTAVAAGPGHS